MQLVSVSKIGLDEQAILVDFVGIKIWTPCRGGCDRNISVSTGSSPQLVRQLRRSERPIFAVFIGR